MALLALACSSAVLVTAEASAQTSGKPPSSAPAKPAKPKAPKPRPTDTRGETPSDAIPPKVTGVPAPDGPASSLPPPAVSPPPLPPPPVPPPWDAASTATSGTSLMPATPAPAPPSVVAPPAVDAAHEQAEEQRMRSLEARLEELERNDAENEAKLVWLNKLKISGFVQGQLVWQWFNAAASPNVGSTGTLPTGIGSNDTIAKGDPALNGVGLTTNGDLFRLRRARLRTEFEPTSFARLVFEFEPFPVGGPNSGGIGTMARNVEAMGIARWSRDVVTDFGVGIFRVPFGFEILQPDQDRPFIEHSWGEQNMFPGEFDTGAHAYTTALDRRLTVQAAVVNGSMLGEKTFSILPDLNQGKDIVGRVNYNLGPIDAGVSGYYGQGQIVDPIGIRFKQFPRWAGNLELALHHTFSRRLGQTRLLAEATLAQNMDRGVNYAFALPAFPLDVINGTVDSKDERSTWLRIEQDFTRWLTVGLRYDFYTPDSAQQNDGRDTYAAVLVAHFTRGLQWMLEVDHAIDNVHKPGAAASSKQIETLSNVLQARF